MESGTAPAAPKGVDVDFSAALKKSWEAFTRNPLELIVGPLLAMLSMLLLITVGPAYTGICNMGLKAARGESIAIGDAFSGYQRFGASFVAALLAGLAILVGALLLIVPGLIALFFFFLPFYFLADSGDLGGVDALKASARAAKANAATVIVTIVINLVLSFVGQITVIGWLVTMPIGVVFTAVVFEQIKASGK